MTGWGFTDRPAVTVGNAVGRGLIGGSGAKAAVLAALEAGTFIPSPHGGVRFAGAGQTAVTTAGQRQRPLAEPAHTITGKGTGAWVSDYAAATRITIEEAAMLQTFPPYALPPAEPLDGLAITALDLFAGAGGWDVAAARLGIEAHGVELMPEAVATRDANGMSTIYRDVWQGLEDRPRLLTGDERDEVQRVLGKMTAGEVLTRYDMLIASPPCQKFSMAGKGTGRGSATEDVLRLIDEGAYLDPAAMRAFAAEHEDDGIALVLAPLAYIAHDLPTFVVLEQVKPVLPIWQAYAEKMRRWGYSVAVDVLSAEQYGVPQTRQRAILIARADGVEATMPTPTHSRYYSRSPEKLDPGVEPWVSMAEALGWGDELPPEKVNDQSGTPYDASWPAGRPALTVAGRDLVPHPGATANRHNGATKSRNDGVKVEAHEAAALQSFPAGMTWAGGKSKVFLQIGNAVPPLLAEAVLKAATRRA